LPAERAGPAPPARGADVGPDPAWPSTRSVLPSPCRGPDKPWPALPTPRGHADCPPSTTGHNRRPTSGSSPCRPTHAGRPTRREAVPAPTLASTPPALPLSDPAARAPGHGGNGPTARGARAPRPGARRPGYAGRNPTAPAQLGVAGGPTAQS